MPRGSFDILPFCPYCGKYKGLGGCKNPDCDRIEKRENISFPNRHAHCIICSSKGVVSCSICNQMYCKQHSEGFNLTKMGSFDQHIGKCVLCGKTVCEQCWIFDKVGNITCLRHGEFKKLAI